MEGGGLFGFLNRFGDMVFLNLIFLITCIPIVTIGPALAALYSVSLKMAKGQEGYVIRGYLKAFKENIRQGIITGIILEIIIAILLIDAKFLYYTIESYRVFGLVVTVMALMAVAFLLPFIFSLMARYSNSIKNTIMNAVLISISRLPQAFLALIITVAPIVLVLLTPYAWIYVIFIGITLSAFLQAKLLNRIFAQIEEKNETDDIDDIEK